MAQHDYVIDNQASAAARTDLNNLFQAIVSQNSGAAAPATTYANMLWYETDTNTLWKRNEANSGWISMGVFDEVGATFTPSGGPVIATQAEAEAGTNNTKMMTPLRVEQAINVQAEGMILLGTLTTTSGTTQTLSGLTLTGYKYLVAEFNGVSHSSGTNQHLLLGAGQVSNSTLTSSNTYFGTALVALTTGVSIGLGSRSTLPSGENAQIAQTGYSTATTSVSVSTALGGTFDAGSVRIYGMR